MHLSELLKEELLAFSKRAKGKELDIVETGTIRGDGENYRVNDGWSTLTFAEWATENGGQVTSIDLDISVAQRVLEDRELLSQVILMQGHSIEVLSTIVAQAWSRVKKNNKGVPVSLDEGFFDVAFLDSDNDGALIFHEYLVVKKIVRSPGLIIVDDVDIDSTEVVKGHEILPWARANNIKHRIVQRSGEGYRTGVLVFEV